MFLSFKKNKETKCISVQIPKNFKRDAVSLSKCLDEKYLWRSRTSYKNPGDPL